MSTNGYRLAIFDLDGTLADTAADVHLSMNLLRAELGMPRIEIKEAKKAIGPGPDLFVKCLTDGQPHLDVKTTLERFREIYYGNVLRTTQLFNGIPEVLQQLSSKSVSLAVVTNKPRKFTRRILQGLEVDHYFITILASEDVEKRKPAPDPILKAMELSGFDPGSTLMIGDTEYDVRAAQAAGVDVCAVGFGYSPREKLSSLRPTFFVERPEEILNLWPS